GFAASALAPGVAKKVAELAESSLPKMVSMLEADCFNRTLSKTVSKFLKPVVARAVEYMEKAIEKLFEYSKTVRHAMHDVKESEQHE
ncbi:MAG: hypothetical protein ACP5KJ_04305, partial [Candidatus Micrarchaeia archaeon]